MIDIIKRFVTNQHDSFDYLCVSGSTFDLDGTQVYDLNIQVIFQRRKKRHISFLDRFVGTSIDTGDVVVVSLSRSSRPLQLLRHEERLCMERVREER